MLNILIIEPDYEMVKLYTSIIHQYQDLKIMASCSTLSEARNIIESGTIHIIILEHSLPDGFGVDFIYEAATFCSVQNCIVITSISHIEVAKKAFRFGAFDYLIKPINSHRLQQSLKELLAFSRGLMLVERLTQSELDNLFRKKERREKLDVDMFTLEMIIDVFHNTNIEHTSESIANMFSVSKTTARRYLEKAVDIGALTVFLEHGQRGRPSKIYRRPMLTELK